jgi:hypothetical protein
LDKENIQEATDLVEDREVQFTVNSPNNVPGERRMTEIFPLRNYVFFNEGSSEIPNRYVSLTKNQVKISKKINWKHLLQKIYQIVQNVK